VVLAATNMGRGAAESAISEGQRRFRRHLVARPNEGMIVGGLVKNGDRRNKIKMALITASSDTSNHKQTV
jgi:hypothetical protein